MKKFSEYVHLKEDGEANDINAVFTKAQGDIKTLFAQLYSKAAEMVKAKGGSELPDDLSRSIMQDLSRIAQKVRRGRKASPVATESLIINDIQEKVSIATGMTPQGVGPQGKPAHDFKAVLDNIYRQVMDRMQQLKDTVFSKLGTLDTMSQQLGNVSNRLNNPAQPFGAGEADKAEDSMGELARLQQLSGGKFKLVAQNGQEIPINPRSEKWKQMVLGAGDKRFKLVGDVNGKPVAQDINVGNSTSVFRAVDLLQKQLGISALPPKSRPVSGNKLRALKLREPK